MQGQGEATVSSLCNLRMSGTVPEDCSVVCWWGVPCSDELTAAI